MNSLDEVLQLLQKETENLTRSPAYQSYLKTMAQFPAYSLHNTLLIHSQMPDASIVAGYRTWKTRFGRSVRKGEKGIRIFIPIQNRQESCQEDIPSKPVRVRFRVAYVFDISQTEGPDLPAAPVPILLEEEIPDYFGWLDRLQHFSRYTIHFDSLEGGGLGLCRHGAKEIIVQAGLSQAQTIKTLLHELAHSLLHNPQELLDDPYGQYLAQHQGIKETEAESVAFVVCRHFGIDCSEYSFPYIVCWKGQDAFLKQSLERIRQTAGRLIQVLEEPEESGLEEAAPNFLPDLCQPGPSAEKRESSLMA